MSYTYLKNKKWENITREERFFCSELFIELRRNIKPFLEILLEKGVIEKKEDNESLWDVGYEVCFYRDCVHQLGYKNEDRIGKTEFRHLPKRTFDLCLFSEEHIIIIEAKAHERFDSKEMDNYKNDIEKEIPKWLDATGKVEISLIALISGKYTPKPTTRKFFKDKILTWEQLYKKYDSSNKHLKRANEVFETKNDKNERRATISKFQKFV